MTMRDPKWRLVIAVTCLASAAAAMITTAVPSGCTFPEDLKTAKFIPYVATGLSENYRSSIGYNGGDDAIVRKVRERVSATDAWETSEQEYSLSFRITSVAHREGGDVVYLAGIRESDCMDVIEEWTFPTKTGGRLLQAAVSTTTTPAVPPVGTPAPPFTLQPSVRGGTYVPVSQRPGRDPAPVRKILWRFRELGGRA